MNPFYAGALAALRRRLANHQDRPPHGSEPLWRLLAEEVSLVLRWLARRTPLPAWLPALLVSASGLGLAGFPLG